MIIVSVWVNLIEIFPSLVSHIETRLKAVSGDEVLIPSSTSTNSVSNSSSTAEVKTNSNSSNATLSVSGDKNSGDKIELVDDHPLGRLIYKFFQFSRIFFYKNTTQTKFGAIPGQAVFKKSQTWKNGLTWSIMQIKNKKKLRKNPN